MQLAILKFIKIYDKIQEKYLYSLRLYSRKQKLLDVNILEEIVACRRMTHNNLSQKLRVMSQLIYWLLARKKMGVTTFVQKILANKRFTPLVALLATYTVILDNGSYAAIETTIESSSTAVRTHEIDFVKTFRNLLESRNSKCIIIKTFRTFYPTNEVSRYYEIFQQI